MNWDQIWNENLWWPMQNLCMLLGNFFLVGFDDILWQPKSIYDGFLLV